MNSRVQGSGVTRNVLLTLVIVVAVLKVAAEVFIPLALAILLTFLVAPMVEAMVRWHVNRTLAVIASMVLSLALIGGLGHLVFNQFYDLAHELPAYQRQLRSNVTQWSATLRGGMAETTKAMQELSKEIERATAADPRMRPVSKVQVVTPPPTALETASQVLGPLVRPVGTTFAVVVLMAFMLLRLPDLRERILRLLGSRNLHMSTEALTDAASRVSRYLLMQLLINGWTGLAVAIGLWYLNVPHALLWGVLTLILRFIPYVGILMALAIPLLLSFAVFDEWSRPLLVLGLYAGVEAFNYVVLEPWLYGSRTGVSPVALLLSAGFWTWLWGLAGLFLAVPMTVCAVVMGKYIPQLQFLEVLLGDEPVLEPHERLYQRLLASNRDQADTVLQEALRSNSMLEVCDGIILPALLLVEEDNARGTLTDERRQTILDHVSQWVEERLDTQEPSRARTTVFPHDGERTGEVLCVPSSDQADEIIAKLLESALIERHLPARVVSARDVVERSPSEEVAPVGSIVVCALPPEAVSPARAVCKRVNVRGNSAPIIVGLWGAAGDLERPRQRLAAAGATRTVTSFAECLVLLEQFMAHSPATEATQSAADRPAPAHRPELV